MEKFRAFMEENGNRIIFIGSTMHDIKNLRTVSMPIFEEKAVLDFFHEISENKEYYNENIRKMKKTVTADNKFSDLEYFQKLLYENYGNFPHLLEFISDELFLYNKDYRNIIPVKIADKDDLIKKVAFSYKDKFKNPDPHKKFNDDARWMLLYLLNYSPDRYVELEKIESDIDEILDQNDPEEREKLKEIFESEYKKTSVLKILTDAKFILQKDNSIKIFDTLIYKTLLLEKSFSSNGLRERLVSEKRMINELIYYYLTRKIENEVLENEVLKKDLKLKIKLFKQGLYGKDIESGCNILHGIARWCVYIEIFEILLEECPELLAYKDNNESKPVVDDMGQTILHYAAATNSNPDILKWLILKSKKLGLKDYLFCESEFGNNVLHYVVEFNPNPQILSFLLSYEEMNEKIVNHQNLEGLTPLLFSCQIDSNIEMMKILLKGVTVNGIQIKSDISMTTYKNRNIMHFVFNPNSTLELLEEKVNLIKEYAGDDFYKMFLYDCDVDENTPYHYAFLYYDDYYNKSNIVKLLVKMEAEINRYEINGWTSLHMAVTTENYDMVTELSAFGADKNISDKLNFTPLHLAVETGKPPEFIELLTTFENINKKTDHNFSESTPLILALNISSNAEEKIPAMKETVKKLIELKVDVEIADNQGNTPLHYAAAFCRDVSIIKMLITKNTINRLNPDGYTPLAIACNPNFGVDKEVIDFLINEGAKL